MLPSGPQLSGDWAKHAERSVRSVSTVLHAVISAHRELLRAEEWQRSTLELLKKGKPSF